MVPRPSASGVLSVSPVLPFDHAELVQARLRANSDILHSDVYFIAYSLSHCVQRSYHPYYMLMLPCLRTLNTPVDISDKLE